MANGEHYHVLNPGEIGDGRKLGGSIYVDIVKAAEDFTERTGKATPQENAAMARRAYRNRRALRARKDKTSRYVYFVICTYGGCDLNDIRE